MNIKDFILGYLIGKGDGGGGSSVDIEPLSVTENGEYSEEGTAYSPVTVDVPNSYTQSDEGKVVSNGALVAQSSDTVTENDTYDTTLINSLTVNVSGGGGGASGGVEPDFRGLGYAYIYSGDFYAGDSKTHYLNFFPLKAGKAYLITFVSATGNVWRGGFFSGKTFADFEAYIDTAGTGTRIEYASYGASDPLGNRTTYTPSNDGEFIVMTNNNSGTSPIYCIEQL